MKNFLIGLGLTIAFFAIVIGLSYGFGWIGVHQTKTIGKAQENARRKVYEQSQSFVEGKRQAAIKYFKEWNEADESGKRGIEYIVAQEFANFDEEQYLTGKVRNFISNCKY